jgi:hypothetical protein
MTPPLTAPDPAVFPADVLAFAAERGVTDYLVPLYELAKHSFGGAAVAVRLEEDAEVANYRWITYEVDTAGRTAEQLFDDHRRYTEALVALCPPPVSECFALGMR